MIYNGEFRSIDTKNDPKGQLYKVVILTNIQKDGYYPYRYVSGNVASRPIKVPILPETLTLADDPFVIKYESQDNVYKPYKCSTATCRIMLDKIQTDFMCTKKNDILVCLLKWNNNVYKSEVYEMKNKVTGATLKMKRINVPGEIPFYNFVPEDYDQFCYNVEWIGYVTPDTYSQDYNLSKEVFELECQDVFSTLKYYDYKVDQRKNRSFSDMISRCAENVDSVYKHVYMTASVKIPEQIPDFVIEGQQTGASILDKLMGLDDNWFNEDGEPESCLKVIESIMQYLGCTLIPYKDSIYITNFDAIGTGQHTYYRYERPQQNKLLIPRNKTVEWLFKDKMSAGTTADIDGTKLALANTQVSTSSTYRKVTLHTDEYYRDKLIIDISEDDHVQHVSDFGTLSRISTVDSVSRKGHSNVSYSFNDSQIIYQGQLLQPRTGAFPGRCVMYNYDLDDWDGTSVVPGNTKRPYPTTWALSTSHCGCTLVEFGANNVSNETVLADINQDYSGNRFFLFNAPAVTQSDGKTPVLWPDALHAKTGFYPSMTQIMLLVETEDLFMRKDQFFQINGKWTFYNTKFYPMSSDWNTTKNEGLAAYLRNMYSFVKIYVTKGDKVKYLTNEINPGPGVLYKYKWVDQDSWCKLFFGGQGYDDFDMMKAGSAFWGRNTYKMAGTNAFENEFSYVKNNRYVDGTIFPVPDFDGSDYVGKLTIAFNRPGGCCIEPGKPPLWGMTEPPDDSGTANAYGHYIPQTSTLRDLDLKIIDSSELTYDHSTEGNNEFEVKMNEYATDDHPTINSLLSSNYKRSTNLAGVNISENKKLGRISGIANNGTGGAALPEKLVVDAIAHTYKDSNLMLNVVVHDGDIDDEFLDTFTWTSQFPGRTFAPNSISVDYAANRVEMTLFEKRADDSEDETRYAPITRNYRRNGDNLINKHIRKDKVVIGGVPQAFPQFRDAVFTKDNRGRLLVSGDVPGLIKYATVEPNFETGEILFAYPNAIDYFSADVSNGDLEIIY